MRKRLQYTPNQITNNLYTSGNEWMTADGVEYIGSYHMYVTDEIFSESTWNASKSKQLIPLVKEDALITTYKKLKTVKTKFQQPQFYIPQVTVQDRINGYITRYFAKKVNEMQIMEINSNQFDLVATKQVDVNLYTFTSINWWITGPITDIYLNGTTTLGVKTKNQQALAAADEVMVGLSAKLSNLIEFYSDTDFIAPKDINA